MTDTSTRSPARPNILCIVSEDCPPWLGAYGDALATTPNLDRLAARGVVFEHAFSTSPVCAPSRFAIISGYHGEAVPPAQHMSTRAHLPGAISTYPELLRERGYYCTNNSKTHYNSDIDPAAIWNESSDTAHWHNRPAASPFLAVFNCMQTHESCVFRPIEGRVTADQVRVPANLSDLPEFREELARYYANIEIMDRFMGERLAELEAAGVAEDTVVIYHSDHASPLPRSKRFCFDDGLHIPLIVHVPERWRHLAPGAPGSRIAAPVSMVDLLSTLLAIADQDAPNPSQGTPFLGRHYSPREFAFSGRDRMDEHYDMMRTARSVRYRYIRNYAPHRIYGQHYAFAWNAKGYQAYEALHLKGQLSPLHDLFWRSKPAEEFYDMAADPASINNLAGSPQHTAELDRHRRALDRHMLDIRDGGFIPEGSECEAASQDQERYPLQRIMTLAAQAIGRDASLVPLFLESLSDSNPVLRYWAAQGLLILSCSGAAFDLPMALLDQEGDIHVRIALLETTGNLGKLDEAVSQLAAIVKDHGHPRVRVQAINALTYLPMHPDLALDAVTAAADDDDEYVRGAAEYLRLRLRGEYRPDSQVFNFERFMAAVGPAAAGSVISPT